MSSLIGLDLVSKTGPVSNSDLVANAFLMPIQGAGARLGLITISSSPVPIGLIGESNETKELNNVDKIMFE